MERLSQDSVNIERLDPRTLTTLEAGDNARFMSTEDFDRLVSNVKRDGCLTSVPFVWYDEDNDQLLVLSGNHRTKAAVAAGLEQIDVMVCREDLTKDQRMAIQLSHNSISGEDDPHVLARLFDGIVDVEFRGYAGLDDEVLALLPPVDVLGLGEAKLDTRTLTFVFFPHEFDEADGQLSAAAKMLPTTDDAYGMDRAQYEGLLDAFDDVERITGVKNRAAALMVILDVFAKHKGDAEDLSV